MRAVFSGAADLIATGVCAALAGLLFGGCQDSYASNAERDTHMGDFHLAAAASTTMSPFAALPPAAPTDVAPPSAAPAAMPAPVDTGAAKDAAAPRPARPHTK